MLDSLRADAFKEGSLIVTAAGPTFVRTLGAGPPVLVVHGGPGFDHTYLAGVLTPLAAKRTLVFYDQPGCGHTPTPPEGLSLLQTAHHLAVLLEELFSGGPFGVLAHSWGALVLIAAACEPSSKPLALSGGVLINPVPVTAADYSIALQRLLARIPGEVTARFFDALTSGTPGAEAVREILPYYQSRPFAVSADPFPLTTATYLAIAGNLSAFDFTAGLPALENISLLLGEDDFTGADLVSEIGNACRHIYVMKQTGHFPFFEDPAEFAAWLERCFP